MDNLLETRRMQTDHDKNCKHADAQCLSRKDLPVVFMLDGYFLPDFGKRVGTSAPNNLLRLC